MMMYDPTPCSRADHQEALVLLVEVQGAMQAFRRRVRMDAGAGRAGVNACGRMIDIFGQALQSYWLGRNEPRLIIRRDDGFVVRQDLAAWFTPRLREHEQWLVDSAVEPIMDLGCGAGRHVLHFQKLGFEIVGLDRSARAVEVCRERGCLDVVDGDVNVHRIAGDGDRFHTLLLFGNNIGIAGTPERSVILLRRLRSALAAKGRILVASIDLSKAANGTHRGYLESNRSAGRSPGQTRIQLEYGDCIGDWFDWIYPEPTELRGWAERAGLTMHRTKAFKDGSFAAVLERNDPEPAAAIVREPVEPC